MKEIDDEKRTSQSMMKSIWEEITHNKNSLDLLIEVIINQEYEEKITILKSERISSLMTLTEEIKKIVQEKLNSILIIETLFPRK